MCRELSGEDEAMSGSGSGPKSHFPSLGLEESYEWWKEQCKQIRSSDPRWSELTAVQKDGFEIQNILLALKDHPDASRATLRVLVHYLPQTELGFAHQVWFAASPGSLVPDGIVVVEDIELQRLFVLV
eukprot:GHVU01156954.1.p1 GENE.GHVU01156954.1~~GHVU01156954.1.p1  ORF type:complete len:128 (+),score=9.60 GHVU01156954.1:842-1225(+)